MNTDSPPFLVREAERADLPAILEVQHRAFGRVAREFGIDLAVLPPTRESLDDLVCLYDAGVRFFAAVTAEGQLVGSVRGSLIEGVVEIGRLVVDDGWQRRGVATAVMDALEAAYPQAERFTLFTGAEATAPLQLYLKRGYTVTSQQDLGYVVLVWLEKSRLAG